MAVFSRNVFSGTFTLGVYTKIDPTNKSTIINKIIDNTTKYKQKFICAADFDPIFNTNIFKHVWFGPDIDH